MCLVRASRPSESILSSRERVCLLCLVRGEFVCAGGAFRLTFQLASSRQLPQVKLTVNKEPPERVWQ